VITDNSSAKRKIKLNRSSVHGKKKKVLCLKELVLFSFFTVGVTSLVFLGTEILEKNQCIGSGR